MMRYRTMEELQKLYILSSHHTSDVLYPFTLQIMFSLKNSIMLQLSTFFWCRCGIWMIFLKVVEIQHKALQLQTIMVVIKWKWILDLP